MRYTLWRVGELYCFMSCLVSKTEYPTKGLGDIHKECFTVTPRAGRYQTQGFAMTISGLPRVCCHNSLMPDRVVFIIENDSYLFLYQDVRGNLPPPQPLSRKYFARPKKNSNSTCAQHFTPYPSRVLRQRDMRSHIDEICTRISHRTALAYLQDIQSHIFQNCGCTFSVSSAAVFLDKGLPQFYNWMLKSFQQSCGAVNL